MYLSFAPRMDAPTDAGGALVALTVDLRQLPLDAETRELHVRAFELRRRVRGWGDGPPGEAEHAETLAELTALRELVRSWPRGTWWRTR